MIDRELPEFVERLEQSESASEALDSLCHELDEQNYWLGKSARAIGKAFYETHHDDYPDVTDSFWDLVKVWAALGVVASLRLVDRALQAQLLEDKLNSNE